MQKRQCQLAQELEPVCFDVEKNIVNHNDHDARTWAQANSLRHAMVLEEILNYCDLSNSNSMNILNASGLASGHMDFSIVSYLKKKASIEYKWTAFESPESRFINHTTFRKYVSELNIRIRLSDFKNAQDLYGPESDYDFAIFTEIAEHLDHSTILSAFSSLQKRLKREGYLYLTTPNVLSLWNRNQILIGNGDFPYWGDGYENFKKGLFGHIVNYDINRLSRLLRDFGFRIIKCGTFTFTQKRYKQTLRHSCFSYILDWLCEHGARLGAALYIVASPDGERKKIQFKI